MTEPARRVRSILVTGASRGFGREVAGAFHRRGWTVFPLVRGAESFAEWSARERCHPILADVADPEVEAATAWSGRERCHPIRADVGDAAVEPAIAHVLAAFGGTLDLLVNNAGHVKKLRWLPATEPADIEEAFRVHCLGAFRCTRAALPFLRAAGNATVVNVTSRFGSIARVAGGEFRGIYSYCLAKSAMDMLTACLDQELRKEGMRVVAVHPGRLRTDVAAVDADTEPGVAAERLADWLETMDRRAEYGIVDLMEGRRIPW